MMRITIRKILFFAACISASAVAYASPVSIKASIDSTTMVMGNRTNVRVTVVKDASASGNLIVPQDSLAKGRNVELAGEPVSTQTDIGNGREQIEYVFPVQSFNPGEYVIPAMKYVSGEDTLLSEVLPLKVLDVDVSDLEKNGLYDYRGVEQPESKFWDFLPDKEQLVWLWWTLGALLLSALIALGFYMYKRWKSGRPILPFLPKKPVLPPYEEAVQALAELKEQKLWERGDVKMYYTKLTDIVRRYIARRYEIGAMEMTSTQIVSGLRGMEQVQEKDRLKALLETSDFVKFAKMTPPDDENERAYASASAFVEANKPEEPSSEEETAGKAASSVSADAEKQTQNKD